MAVIDQLFDEAFYLESYPDVAAAVAAGQIPNGRSHFLASGIREGRTRINRFYRDDVEAQYLTQNPDVAAVVASGGLASGLQHYLGNGESEGRSLFSGGFDEEWYRRRYPDVAEAISQGIFTSGLEHYLAFGRGETRSASPLFELDYFDTYPDVRAARDAGGIYLSAADHYSATGNFEGRQATFSGTNGDDTVVGGAAIDTLTGVQLDVADSCFIGRVRVDGPCLEYDSFGLNEQDVLIGGPGLDSFRLGIAQPVPLGFQSFYQGNGDVDFARILNFEPGRDTLILATRNGPADAIASGTEFETTPEGIKVYAINAPTANVPGVPIPRDLIAIVDGITNPSDVLNSTVFLAPADVFMG
ncbi:MAG: hypothetical protein AAGF75_03105 [Cyanobacteria bacterium P01_H01_bin.130]